MARKSPDESQEKIETINHAPVESIPDQGMTRAAQITPVYEKGSAVAEPSDVKTKHKVYRVLADKNISSNGARALLRAGKEFDDRTYNPISLMRQGVKLEEIGEIEV
jgi:hypothetical protein